jgi:asparagine synthase (glutamine-hydrolysing)
MCGIAGIAGSINPIEAQDAVRRMTNALARRGPDSDGIECYSGALLGHRRLAIFDLSDLGRQPMSSDEHDVGIVFNGAIYNFRELRDELRSAGYSFRSNTDTEVLVQGYRAWGIDRLVQRLRGMFAFGLWDDRTRTLFLVRDRLGVKPLLYASRGSSLAFASTTRALRAGGWTGDLDATAVGEFLEYGYVSESRVIYEGVTKVPPASIAEWTGNGRPTVRRYWSPPQPTRATVRFDDAVSATEDLLVAAVEARLHADVPVGALLSGGIDSALVCWAIAKLGADLTAFTVSTPGHPDDEADDARATARELGLRQQVLTLSDLDGATVRQVVAAYSEPFACESALGMLRVSEAVAGAGTKVLLTGDGGDDVFLGYPRHRHLLTVERIARFMPSAATPAWCAARSLVPQIGALRRGVHFADYVTGGLPAFLAAHPGLDDFRTRGLLGERLATVTVAHGDGAWSVAGARRVLEAYLEHDLGHQFVSEYLTKVDGATMHYALEARSPFFDQTLWEYASSLPVAVRLHSGRLKAVLREIARRRIGPRVAAGRKRGFSIPVSSWMAGRWRTAAAESLTDSLLSREGWTRADGVRRALDDASSSARLRRQLWYLWVLEEWLRYERAAEPNVASIGVSLPVAS